MHTEVVGGFRKTRGAVQMQCTYHAYIITDKSPNKPDTSARNGVMTAHIVHLVHAGRSCLFGLDMGANHCINPLDFLFERRTGSSSLEHTAKSYLISSASKQWLRFAAHFHPLVLPKTIIVSAPFSTWKSSPFPPPLSHHALPENSLWYHSNPYMRGATGLKKRSQPLAPYMYNRRL